jgi:hypothetical protein
MEASTTKSWTTPIRVDAAAVAELNEIVRAFVLQNRQSAVAHAERNYSPIWGADDNASEQMRAQWADAEDKRLNLLKEDAANSASKITLTVTLANERVLHEVSMEDLTIRCGKGDRAFARIQYGVSDYRAGHLFIDIGGFNGEVATYSLAGSADTVDLIETRLQQWGEGVRLRYGWVGSHSTPLDILMLPIFLIAGGFALMLGAFIVGALLGISEDVLRDAVRPYLRELSPLMAYTLIGGVGLSLVRGIWGEKIQRLWRKVFPVIEFKLGDNVAVVEERQKLRRAMWAFPVGSIAIPILINLVT